MNFGASKTIVSYKHIKQPVQKHILCFLGVNLFFNSTIHLMVHLLDSTLNPNLPKQNKSSGENEQIPCLIMRERKFY